jgi:hypothetical protein
MKGTSKNQRSEVFRGSFVLSRHVKQQIRRELYMKTQVERSQFDDYELPDEVDFTEAIRGRFYQPKKISMTIRLDDDIVRTSKNLAPLVFRVPNFIFLPEGRGLINELHVVFLNPPSFRLPSR